MDRLRVRREGQYKPVFMLVFLILDQKGCLQVGMSAFQTRNSPFQERTRGWTPRKMVQYILVYSG